MWNIILLGLIIVSASILVYILHYNFKKVYICLDTLQRQLIELYSEVGRVTGKLLELNQELINMDENVVDIQTDQFGTNKTMDEVIVSEERENIKRIERIDEGKSRSQFKGERVEMNIVEDRYNRTISNNKRRLNEASVKENSGRSLRRKATKKETINLTPELKEDEILLFKTDIEIHSGKTNIHLDPRGKEIKSNRDKNNNIRKWGKG